VTLLVAAAWGDSVRWGERSAEGIYLIETKDGYYVCDPRSGDMEFVEAEAVDRNSIVKSPDRAAIWDAWKEKQPASSASAASADSEGVFHYGRSESEERSATVNEDGTPTLVLKGNQQADPLRQQALALMRAQQIYESELAAAQAQAQQAAWEAERRQAEAQAYEEQMRALRLEEQRLRVQRNAWYSDGPYRNYPRYNNRYQSRGWGTIIGDDFYIGPWQQSDGGAEGSDFGPKNTYPWSY